MAHAMNIFLKISSRFERYCFHSQLCFRLQFLVNRERVLSSPVRKTDFSIIQARTFFWRRTIRSVFEKDGVEFNENTLVYNTPFGTYILLGQLVFCFSALAGVFIFGPLGLVDISAHSNDLLYSHEFYIMFGGYFAIICLVPAVVKPCLLRAYYNEEKKLFTMIFPGILPLGTRKFTCRPGDVMHKEGLIFPTIFGEFYLGRKRFTMHEDSFRTPHYFNVLLGYTRSPSDVTK